jgi:hypothetical protein
LTPAERELAAEVVGAARGMLSITGEPGAHGWTSAHESLLAKLTGAGMDRGGTFTAYDPDPYAIGDADHIPAGRDPSELYDRSVFSLGESHPDDDDPWAASGYVPDTSKGLGAEVGAAMGEWARQQNAADVVHVTAACGLDWTGPRHAWEVWVSDRHAHAHNKGADGLSAICPGVNMTPVNDPGEPTTNEEADAALPRGDWE